MFNLRGNIQADVTSTHCCANSNCSFFVQDTMMAPQASMKVTRQSVRETFWPAVKDSTSSGSAWQRKTTCNALVHAQVAN